MSRTASLERALFVSRGMVAWMQTWPGRAEVGGAGVVSGGYENAALEQGVQDRAAFPEDLRAAVTELLAGIAWSAIRS